MRPQSRQATPEDEPFLFELYRSTREDLSLLPEQMYAQILEMQYKARRAQYASSYPDARQTILIFEGKSIGAVIVEEGKEIRLVDIALLPEFRNRGFGTAAIKGLCELGKPVGLQVRLENPALALYQRLGFAEVGRDEMYIEMRWNL